MRSAVLTGIFWVTRPRVLRLVALTEILVLSAYAWVVLA